MSNKTETEEVLGCLLIIIVGGFLMGIIFGLQLWINMYGWGLSVQSWPVIIGGWIFVVVLQMLLAGLSRLGRG